MKLYWHTQKNNTRLILIFNGWGFDHRILNSLLVQQTDALLIYDYTIIDKEALLSLPDYEQVDLLAWSFGVFVANECASVLPTLKQCVAVNGTLTPVHDKYGIPPNIFYTTMHNYNEENKKRFAMRIAGGNTAYKVIQEQLPLRNAKEQLIELAALEKRFHFHSKNILSWTKAVLSENDRVFPFSNMVSAWEKIDNVLITPIQGNHYIDFNLLVENLMSC